MEIIFSDADTIVNLVQMIGERNGHGDILAEGSQLATKKLGDSKFVIRHRNPRPLGVVRNNPPKADRIEWHGGTGMVECWNIGFGGMRFAF